MAAGSGFSPVNHEVSDARVKSLHQYLKDARNPSYDINVNETRRFLELIRDCEAKERQSTGLVGKERVVKLPHQSEVDALTDNNGLATEITVPSTWFFVSVLLLLAMFVVLPRIDINLGPIPEADTPSNWSETDALDDDRETAARVEKHKTLESASNKAADKSYDPMETDSRDHVGTMATYLELFRLAFPRDWRLKGQAPSLYVRLAMWRHFEMRELGVELGPEDDAAVLGRM